MKKVLLILLLFSTHLLPAQQYNNEWIDYNKTYYKFKIGATGLYRISQAVLAANNLGNVSADQFQLWKNGVEVPIYTSVQTGTLPTDGYVEFWGEKNDAKTEQELYRTPDQQINTAKSLFTDTAAYFLTVNPSGNNKRFVPVANTLPTGISPEQFFTYTTGFYLTEAYHYGRPEGRGSEALYPSSFEDGEGWASSDLTNGKTRTFSQNLYAYTGAGASDPVIKMNVVGDYIPAGPVENRRFSLKLNGNIIFDTLVKKDYAYIKLSKVAAASLLNGNSESFVLANQSATTDRMRLAFIEATYSRKFNFGGSSSFRFQLPPKNTGHYLEISNFSYSGTPVLYDLTNGRRFEVNTSSPVLKVFIPASFSQMDLLLVSEAPSNVKAVTTLEQRNFVNYGTAANQGNYLMITHANILNGPNGSNPVEEYRAYRSSAAGGSFTAKIYMIDQLTDQFAFGIKNNPLSIRNFIRYAREKNEPNYSPKFIFLIGKGVNYVSGRSSESNAAMSRLGLVPTFGYPGSDKLLAAQGASSVPLVPIGRLSVINGTELANYLEKVKQYEAQLVNTSGSIEDNLWKKNTIHMIGANDQGTTDVLNGILSRQRLIIEDTLYGASVTNFVKDPSSTTGQLLSEKLTALINGGIGLLSYLGHSSATTLSFNLENPDNYSNHQKYPVFNMMGCDVGNIFTFNTTRLTLPETVSEKYLLAKERGSIAMMAGTGLGYVSSIDPYNQLFYTLLSRDDYGKTLGELMQHTVQKMFSSYPEDGSNTLKRAHSEEFTLNGDPAIRLYQQAKPDYAIEDKYVEVNPSFVSVAENTFSIKAKIFNIGKAVNQKVVVEVKRILPNSSSSIIKKDTLNAIKFSDSLEFKVPIDPLTDKGSNKIVISIDPANTIDEMNETNNVVTKEIYIFEDEIRPVYPYEYAIINQQNTKLIASTADPLSTPKTYLMELDTSMAFNSSTKVTASKNSGGGIIEFDPGINFKNNQVYYWRVAIQPAQGEEAHWNTSSFTYLQGDKVGYGQGHKDQFLKDRFDSGIEYDNRFLFSDKRTDIDVNTTIIDYAGYKTAEHALFINNVRVQAGLYKVASGGGKDNVNVLRFYILDGKTMQPWQNQQDGIAQYGSINGVPENSTVQLGFFHFKISTPDERKIAMAFIDSIPEGNIIIMVNGAKAPFTLPDEWAADTAQFGKGNSLYHKLINLGFSNLDQLTSFKPFIFAIKKGAEQALAQHIASQPQEAISENFNVSSPSSEGYFDSDILGPAKKWDKFLWTGGSVEQPSADTTSFDIIGIDKDGNEDVIKQNINAFQQEEVDLSFINATHYPSLRLRMRSKDAVNFDPYQLSYWRLYGTMLPEGAIAPNLYFAMKDTLDPGEPLKFGVAFKNISPYNFDSITVRMSVKNNKNIEIPVNVDKQKALVTGDTIRLTVPIATKQLVGTNTLNVQFNPDNDQPEQYLFNNFLYKNFFIKGDSLNPYLDVTFDGIRILNNDIVSSKPDILIKLTDDSKWLLLTDPNLITVQLKKDPKGNGPVTTYSIGTDTLVFTPGTGEDGKNIATMNFRPLLDDGDYQLIISAKDESGNKIGDMEYRVDFQVINKPMISNLLNYPNPFTTSTAFVFTLTGSEVPQNIRIQILTITGKIVREITKQELGPIHIGRNITEYKWDGTDQYGQKLANGVYLYRVITNLNGKSLDKYKSANDNTDKYFNKGYGKMYLMR